MMIDNKAEFIPIDAEAEEVYKEVRSNPRKYSDKVGSIVGLLTDYTKLQDPENHEMKIAFFTDSSVRAYRDAYMIAKIRESFNLGNQEPAIFFILLGSIHMFMIQRFPNSKTLLSECAQENIENRGRDRDPSTREIMEYKKVIRKDTEDQYIAEIIEAITQNMLQSAHGPLSSTNLSSTNALSGATLPASDVKEKKSSHVDKLNDSRNEQSGRITPPR
jgi:hypothetical protein